MSVLDASALLALVLSEPGAEAVGKALAAGGALISTVNLAEVLARVRRAGHDVDAAAAQIARLPLAGIAFTEEHALESARLLPATRALGLSFGDRACLALARERHARVLTADRAWKRLRAGIEIEVIR